MAQDLLNGLIMLSVTMDNTHLEWIVYVYTVANAGSRALNKTEITCQHWPL